MARVTGPEPATSGVTGRRSNQLSYTRAFRAAHRLGAAPLGQRSGARQPPSPAQCSAWHPRRGENRAHVNHIFWALPAQATAHRGPGCRAMELACVGRFALSGASSLRRHSVRGDVAQLRARCIANTADVQGTRRIEPASRLPRGDRVVTILRLARAERGQLRPSAAGPLALAPSKAPATTVWRFRLMAGRTMAQLDDPRRCPGQASPFALQIGPAKGGSAIAPSG